MRFIITNGGLYKHKDFEGRNCHKIVINREKSKRVNMQGVVFKGEYNLRDNVFLNFAAGHATRKNNALAAVGAGNDLNVNLDSFDLYQFDVTYKF